MQIGQEEIRKVVSRYVSQDYLIELDDLEQEAWVTLMSNIDSYDEEVDFKVWALGVAKWGARNYARKMRKKGFSEGPELIPTTDLWSYDEDGVLTPIVEEETPATQESLLLAQENIDALNERQQRLVSKLSEGLTQEEIAEEEGVSQQAVQKRVRTIRKKMS